MLGSQHLLMTFVDTYAKQLQLSHTVLQRATGTILELIRRYASERDQATMCAAMPEFTACTEAGFAATDSRPSSLTRLARRMQRIMHTARTTRQALQATGLGNDDVTFVSAFALYVKQHLGEELMRRLLHCVPGLQSMTSWPLTPYRSEPGTSTMP